MTGFHLVDFNKHTPYKLFSINGYDLGVKRREQFLTSPCVGHLVNLARDIMTRYDIQIPKTEGAIYDIVPQCDTMAAVRNRITNKWSMERRLKLWYKETMKEVNSSVPFLVFDFLHDFFWCLDFDQPPGLYPDDLYSAAVHFLDMIDVPLYVRGDQKPMYVATRLRRVILDDYKRAAGTSKPLYSKVDRVS